MDVVAQLGAAGDALQGAEDGDDVVAVAEMEANVEGPLTIKPLPGIEGASERRA